MSKSTSLTPDEKNAGIRKAAALSDELVRDDKLLFTMMRQPMQRYITIQQRVAQALAQLDPDTVSLDILNTNASIVDRVRTQIRNAAQDFLARNKVDAAEKNLKNRFDELVKVYSDNPILKEIDRNRNYHYMNNRGHGSSSESKSETRIHGYTGAIRDSMLQVLGELKETELMTPARMQASQAYYREVIIHYLRKKMYGAYKQATRLDTTHQVIEDILKKLRGLLYKPDDKTPGFSKFANELKQIVSTKASLLLKDKTGKEFEVKMNLLPADAGAKSMQMEDILSDQYSHFSMFEKQMMAFRDKQYSSWKSSLLYNLLPDTMAKNIKSKNVSPDEKVPEIETDHFPYIQDKAEHKSFSDAYKEYQRQIHSVELTSDRKIEMKTHRDVLRTNIDTAIQHNFSDGAVRLLVINLQNILKVEEDGLAIIVAIMIKVLASDRYPEPEFADPKFEAIFQEITVLGLVEKLEKYAAGKDKLHRELKDYLVLLSANLQVPVALENLIQDNAKVEKFKHEIRQYHILQTEYDQAERSKTELQDEANTRIDRPLIELLRAQVLHAATLYFNPAEKPGWMHALHHPFSERKSVLHLIHQLFSPELTTFAAAVGHIRTFMASQKGLHTNSLDTLLSYVLYNEGRPRGLFNMKLSDVMTFNLHRVYPGYNPDDLHYRKGDAEISKADIKAIKTYLHDNYRVPEASMVGRVGSMVRGQRRLEKATELNIVRQQLVTNLVNRATLVEQFKAGQEIEFKEEARPAAQQAKR
jgi:hypothetical protein